MKRLFILLGIGLLIFYVLPGILLLISDTPLVLMPFIVIINPLYSLVAGFFNTKWRFIFPLFIGVLFMPSTFILFNIPLTTPDVLSSLVTVIQYTVIAYFGAGLLCLKPKIAHI